MIHSLVGAVQSTGVYQCSAEDTCPGLLYRMWLIGFYIYLAWMSVCMSFVFVGTSFQVLLFEDWSASMPLGFIGCQRVIDAFV